MKKNIFAITAAAALVLNIAATSVTTFAADGDTPDATTKVSGTQGTKGTIELTLPKNEDGSSNGIELTKAPSIDFGSQEIKSDGGDYQSKTIDSALQVINHGVDQDWTVTLTAGEFTGDKGTLTGATLSLAKGTAAAEAQDNKSGAAEAVAYTGNVANTVFSAAKGNGVGTWNDTFNGTDANLNVPAGNVAGSYTADLTWNLNNAPMN